LDVFSYCYYSIFEKECPGGNVSEERLREIYLQFFPQGSKRVKNKRLFAFILLIFSSIDSIRYSHYLFSIIDRNHKGTFTFDVKLFVELFPCSQLNLFFRIIL